MLDGQSVTYSFRHQEQTRSHFARAIRHPPPCLLVPPSSSSLTCVGSTSKSSKGERERRALGRNLGGRGDAIESVVVKGPSIDAEPSIPSAAIIHPISFPSFGTMADCDGPGAGDRSDVPLRFGAFFPFITGRQMEGIYVNSTTCFIRHEAGSVAENSH